MIAIKGLAQGLKSCVDLIVATPGIRTTDLVGPSSLTTTLQVSDNGGFGLEQPLHLTLAVTDLTKHFP